ncbi:hypothetical protein TNCV_3543401 [Trichonephila clavipes]|nr:hypothetical protein TNCV_3543401 [Trichonephila clavipes]
MSNQQKFLVKLNKSAAKTFQILTEAYGDETLHSAHVFERYKTFSGRKVSVEDDETAGRPSSSSSPEKFIIHWCAKIKDEVEKLAYQLNEEAERTERPIRD